MKKVLVTYYSWTNGNTKTIAETLAETLGADIAEIQLASDYTGAYDDVVAQGKREVDSAFHPEMLPLEVDTDDYDVIITGTPTWWYSMAPAVLSFLDAADFTGKIFIPFMTNAGWPGTTLKDMEYACGGADVKFAKEFLFDSKGGEEMRTPAGELSTWMNEIAAFCKR